MRIYQFLTVSLIVLLACSTNNTPTFEVSVTVDPPEAGSVISTPSESIADKGTSISLRAEANEGWVFGNWGGDINSTNNPTTFTLDSDKSIVANFEEKKYPLSINIVGEGEVTEQVIALPKSADYLSGTIVRLTAVPAEDWLFQGWAEFPDSSYTIDLVITEATSVTVTFKSDFWKRLDNGVTITCSKAAIGETGIIDGVEYTKRTREQITVENAATTCTSGIEDMNQLFYYKEGFNEDISHWDVSSVTNLSEMFYYTKSFNQDISEWDVSSVTNMRKMLHSNELFNQDISKWDVSSVTNMSDLFGRCKRFNQDISNWDVSSVTDMSYMFWDAISFNQNIGDWDVSSVTNMFAMFVGAISFNQDISNWDVSNVTNMRAMFSNTLFNQDITGWNVSSVTNMAEMFASAAFNQNISEWDVSNVTDMSSMFVGKFDYANIFNQDISNWDVSSVTKTYRMFTFSEFNQDISEWDVSSVTDMAEMFSFTPFNQDISNWDVTSVINMYGMFYNAQLFNQDIGSWDVNSVNNLDLMFYYAKAFNQNLSKWCVSYFTSEPYKFSEDSPLTEENKPKWGTCPSN